MKEPVKSRPSQTEKVGIPCARNWGGRIHRLALCLIASASTLILFGVSAGQAQQRPAQQLDPRQIERKLEQLQGGGARVSRNKLNIPGTQLSEASSDATPLCTLASVAVNGGEKVPAALIAEVYRPYIGHTVSKQDLATIANEISDLYRKQGYYLTRAIVPPQDVKNGRIAIRVIEGRITEIVLNGPDAEKFGIRSLLNPLLQERVAQRRTLERHLLLINDLPGVHVTDTALQEIGIATGHFRLTVYLKTWRIFAAASVDNRGIQAIGPLQAYLTSSLNSSLVPGDTLGIGLATVPDSPRELKFGRLFYNAPVGSDGVRIGVSAVRSQSREGGLSSLVGETTRSENYAVTVSSPLVRTRESSLWLSTSFAVENATDKDDAGVNYKDHVRPVAISADYQAHDQLDGWNYLTLGFTQGLNIFGASRGGDPLLSRPDASALFSKLQLFYTRYQKFTDNWSLKLSAAGQLASKQLLTPEQFYLGAPFGRGYFGVQTGGDNAIAGSVELRFDQKLNRAFVEGYQLYAFLDHTTVWSSGDSARLSLIGAGVRFYLPHDLQAGIEIDQPLEYRTDTEQPRQARAFFYVAKVIKFCPGSTVMSCS